MLLYQNLCLLIPLITVVKTTVMMTGGRKTFNEQEIASLLEEEVLPRLKFKDVLGKAALQYNQQSNNMYRAVLGDITKVQSQVVQGMKYFVEAKMNPTECRNSEEGLSRSLGACPASDGNSKNVEFVLWMRSWLPNEEDRLQITVNPILQSDNKDYVRF